MRTRRGIRTLILRALNATPLPVGPAGHDVDRRRIELRTRGLQGDAVHQHSARGASVRVRTGSSRLRGARTTHRAALAYHVPDLSGAGGWTRTRHLPLTRRAHNLLCFAGVVPSARFERALAGLSTRCLYRDWATRTGSSQARIRTSTSRVQSAESYRLEDLRKGWRADDPPAGFSDGAARPRSAPSARPATPCPPRRAYGCPFAGCSRRRRRRC